MYLEIYLTIVNIATFVVWCLDKHFAKSNHRRISEKALFLWAIAGGSLGSLCAMHMIRHKTRHWYFVIGIPIILILQAATIIYIFLK